MHFRSLISVTKKLFCKLVCNLSEVHTEQYIGVSTHSQEDVKQFSNVYYAMAVYNFFTGLNQLCYCSVDFLKLFEIFLCSSKQLSLFN